MSALVHFDTANSITRQVVVQKWEEHERGWGTRPDGYSLHLSLEHLTFFIKEYWDSMPDESPDEYSAPDGTSYVADVGLEVYEKVAKSKCGVFLNGTPPGSQGKDGWRNLDSISAR
jgi:hypothetical protein